MTERQVSIVPSILSADFSRLGEQVRDALEAGIRWIQIDVMDGHFVPNITVGPLVVEAIRPLLDEYHAWADVHLMIQQPERYLEAFARAGADVLTVHVEVSPHLHRTVQAIHDLDTRAGVALNPTTPLSAIEEILPDIDLILVMTVNPGFGGQRFIGSSLDKLRRLREMLAERGLEHVYLQVDGGINADTIAEVVRAGATSAVAGSAVFNKQASVAASIEALLAALRAAE